MVEQFLQKQQRTAAGPDDLPYWFWKNFSLDLAPVITTIFNRSLMTRMAKWRGWVGRASWVVRRGSCVVRRGSCVVGRGSWVVGRGSWVVRRGYGVGRRINNENIF